MKRILPLSMLLFLLLFPAASFADHRLPVAGGGVTSGVGWRLDPFGGGGRMTYHRGVDIAVPEGTPVFPVKKGTVYFAGPYKGCKYGCRQSQRSLFDAVRT
ncbi:MAG: hypothetical protein M0C28_21585 [Candidatus Moduliflexus flocculans]|nr:hypothetical protein [Candidatus Moduliflexus flocculans]